jgi:hypothetical protein
MKKLLFISLLFLSFSAVTHSQTVTVFNSNVGEALSKRVTTTNATATQIDSIAVANDEVGVITVKILGYRTDSTGAVTGTKTYRYTKVAGTLTVGSVIQNPTDTLVADTPLTGATFTVTATSSNNLIIKVTGKASKTIYWISFIKKHAYRIE